MIERRAGLCDDIDNSSGMEAELCRQGAGDQAHGVDQARVEFLSESADRLREEHSIDAIG